MFAPSDSKPRFFKISIYNGCEISALRRMPSMTRMLHTALFPKFLRGHTWGRKSVFYLHLDNHRTCMNRLYTSHIFPILRKNKKIKNCLNILLRLLLFTRTTNSSSLLWQTLASATLQNYGLAAASNLQCVFSAQLIVLALIPWFE